MDRRRGEPKYARERERERDTIQYGGRSCRKDPGFFFLCVLWLPSVAGRAGLARSSVPTSTKKCALEPIPLILPVLTKDMGSLFRTLVLYARDDLASVRWKINHFIVDFPTFQDDDRLDLCVGSSFFVLLVPGFGWFLRPRVIISTSFCSHGRGLFHRYPSTYVCGILVASIHDLGFYPPPPSLSKIPAPGRHPRARNLSRLLMVGRVGDKFASRRLFLPLPQVPNPQKDTRNLHFASLNRGHDAKYRRAAHGI